MGTPEPLCFFPNPSREQAEMIPSESYLDLEQRALGAQCAGPLDPVKGALVLKWRESELAWVAFVSPSQVEQLRRSSSGNPSARYSCAQDFLLTLQELRPRRPPSCSPWAAERKGMSWRRNKLVLWTLGFLQLFTSQMLDRPVSPTRLTLKWMTTQKSSGSGFLSDLSPCLFSPEVWWGLGYLRQSDKGNCPVTTGWKPTPPPQPPHNQHPQSSIVL